MSIMAKGVSFDYFPRNNLHNIRGNNCLGNKPGLGRKALEGVSFELREGELVCLLGENGAGKSTLFRCVLGINQRYSGSITLDGQEIRSFKPRELAQRIAYIPQHGSTVFGYTAFEMVLMGTTASLGAFGVPGKEQRNAAEEAMSLVGIEKLADRRMSELSGGEKQLVLAARALAQRAKFLLMDEPAASLDFGNRLRVMELVKRLTEQGYGILLSTHDPDQALQYADRALVLHRGRQLSFGSTEDAVTGEILSKAYGVKVRIDRLCLDGGSRRICTAAVGKD